MKNKKLSKRRKMRKRVGAVLLSLCVLAGAAPVWAAEAQAEEIKEPVGLEAEYHTQEEIRTYVKNHPIQNMKPEFAVEQSATVPYAAGELTEETKQDALNMLNLLRYIAGVPTVSISEEAQNYAQTAALLLAITGKLDHHPEDHPQGMDDAMFQQGFYGCANANLSRGGDTLNQTLIEYMLETNGDPGFGHRYRLLDYETTEVGFGVGNTASYGRFTATYTNMGRNDYLIAYPGQNQPLEYFGPAYAWTVLIPEKPDESAVNVKVTNVKTNQEWNFNQSTNNLKLASHGSSVYAIFSPSTDYHDQDQYKVEITGIANPISYEVNMFWLNDLVPLESIRMEQSGTVITEGDTGSHRVVYVPENASNKVVTWTSSNLEVVEPVWAGTGICSLIAKKPGMAVLTATAEDGGHTAQMNVVVKPKATSITLNETDLTIGVGQSFVLTGTAFPKEAEDGISFATGSSDYDGNLISVEPYLARDGVKITGKALGETSIQAYASHNKDAAALCRIRVVEPVNITDFYFEQPEIELMIGDTVSLSPVIGPDNYTCKGFEWSVDGYKVARVEDGAVTAEQRGEAVVTVKTMDGSGKEAQCVVKVYDKYKKADTPRLDYASAHAIAVEKMVGCEYSMDLENWQISPEFTGLEPDHEYSFYARERAYEAQYWKAGDASEGAVFRTLPESSDECPHTNKKIVGAVEASCLKGGYSGDTYCADCGRKLCEGKATQAAGHSYVGKVTKNPTTSEKGVRTYTCSKCKDSYTEPIPKLSSAAAKSIQKAAVTLSKETCNYTGKPQKPKVKAVKLSGKILKPGVDYTDKYQRNVNIGTAFVQITGKGLYCGTVTKQFSIAAKKGSRYTIGGYKYLITGASTVSVTGGKSTKMTKIKIPKTVKIGGKAFRITSIGSRAFRNYKKLTSVEIGDCVKTIGASAFEGCTKLKKAAVGKGVTEIGGNAFKNCKKLATLQIKSVKLKKVGKNALKGIPSAARIQAPAKKRSAYKKLLNSSDNP